MNWIGLFALSAMLLTVLPPVAKAGCTLFWDYFEYNSSINTCELKGMSGCNRPVNKTMTCKDCQVQAIGTSAAEEAKGCWDSASGGDKRCFAIFYRYLYNHTAGACNYTRIAGCPSSTLGFSDETECYNTCKNLPICPQGSAK